MAETSYFWDGTSLGDAVFAPYSLQGIFRQAMRAISGLSAVANKGAVVAGYLNQLKPTVVGGTVQIDTGAAIVDGSYYNNDAAVQVAIPTPVSGTRIDLVVLNWQISTQQTRLLRVVGAEGGGVPSLTQNESSVWQFPLAQASITTGGAITLTDLRSFTGAVSSQPSAATFNMAGLSTISVTGTTTSTDLSNPPSVGSIVMLEFQSAGCAITSGNHWKLEAANNFTSVAGGLLVGTIDGSGNFVEVYRSSGQGIKRRIWESHSVATVNVSVANATATVALTGLATITTPTLLATDEVRVKLQAPLYGLYSGQANGWLLIDRGGTKLPNTTASSAGGGGVDTNGGGQAYGGGFLEVIDVPGAGAFAYSGYGRGIADATSTMYFGNNVTNGSTLSVEVWR